MSEPRFQPSEGADTRGTDPVPGSNADATTAAAGAPPPMPSGADHPALSEGTPRIPADATITIQADAAKRLGTSLAYAVKQGKYHPVVLFGTTSSGKTSLLLSLFASLRSDARLETTLSLGEPLLGKNDSLSLQLHKEARHTFENKTEQFIRGKRPQATMFNLPLFVPVTFTPGDGKPPVKFAMLEGKGDGTRQTRRRSTPIRQMPASILS